MASSFDYFESIQSPESCFNDPELQRGEVSLNSVGLPELYCGSFSTVFKVTGASQGTWAIKCYNRVSPGLHEHYRALSEYLRQVRLPYFVDFTYHEQGIRVGGQWYPILKTPWVRGPNLDVFVREHADQPRVMRELSQNWAKMARRLRQARIAHCDLQPGNVIIGSIKLVDYDAMYVPSLTGQQPTEIGHPDYQHPQRRLGAAVNEQTDNFSHLAIYTAIRSLEAGGATLLNRYTFENLLFRKQDFVQPESSPLLRELRQSDDAQVRALSGHLVLASRAPLDKVPSLDDLIADDHVEPLSATDERQVDEAMRGWKKSASISVPGTVREPSVESKASSGQTEIPLPITDKVSFSLIAPAILAPGNDYTFAVWIHLEHQRSEVISRGREALAGLEPRIQSKSGVLVTRGNVVVVRLSIPGLLIEESDDSVYWDGDIGNATFSVAVPKEIRVGRCTGQVTFYVGGLLIARLNFNVEVGPRPSEASHLPARIDRFRTAFASYASKDRDEVLGRIQGMQAILPELDIFFDVKSLRSGDRWPDRLLTEIQRREVFYLFWSLHAKQSEWVEKEWRTALNIHGVDIIHPIPLVHPEAVPPPPELGSQLHFNDWVLAYIRGTSKPQ